MYRFDTNTYCMHINIIIIIINNIKFQYTFLQNYLLYLETI